MRSKQIKSKQIYCVHSWESHECGDRADTWRECERCGSRWDSISDKKTGKWLEWPRSIGAYGQEPQTVIGLVK